MERLTKRYYEGVECDLPYVTSGIVNCGDCFEGEVIDRLASYEDAEEQGRLVVLPCKVGTKIYILSPRIYAAPIIKEAFFSLTYHDVEDFGKTVFFTRQEAEKALEAQNVN